MNKKKSMYNLISGVIRQVVSVAIGLILPRLILQHFGSEVNGLMSSVTQLVTYLGLLEVGVGTATLQALYKPIADRDTDKVNGILSSTHSYYKRTGMFYALGVILFSMVYPFFVNTDINNVVIISFIFISGISGVMNYFFQGKYNILLQAEGENYILSIVTTVVSLVSSVMKIVLILLGFNIIIVQASFILFNAAQIMFIQYYVKKKYPWINVKAKPDYKAISQKNAVMVHEISYLVFSQTDLLLLTMLTGNLKLVSIYAIYNMLYGAMNNILTVASQSIQFVLGQTFSQSLKRYIKIYNLYELIYISIYFMAFTITLAFTKPFISLYTQNVKDVNYLIPYLPLFFLGVNLLTCLRTVCNQTITVSGSFEKTKWSAVVEMIINIVASIIGIKIFGIYGALAGTILALMFKVGYLIYFTNRIIMKKSVKRTWFRILHNLALLAMISTVINNMHLQISSFIQLGIHAVGCLLVTAVVWALSTFIFEKEAMKDLIEFVKLKNK